MLDHRHGIAEHLGQKATPDAEYIAASQPANLGARSALRSVRS